MNQLIKQAAKDAFAQVEAGGLLAPDAVMMFRQAMVDEALVSTRGNQLQAAIMLDMNRGTLRRIIKESL